MWANISSTSQNKVPRVLVCVCLCSCGFSLSLTYPSVCTSWISMLVVGLPQKWGTNHKQNVVDKLKEKNIVLLVSLCQWVVDRQGYSSADNLEYRLWKELNIFLNCCSNSFYTNELKVRFVAHDSYKSNIFSYCGTQKWVSIFWSSHHYHAIDFTMSTMFFTVLTKLGSHCYESYLRKQTKLPVIIIILFTNS